MRLTPFILLLSLALVSCERRSNNKSAPPRTSPEKSSWTPQEIAADPEGYILWSDKQVDKQINAHEARLKTLTDRRTQFEVKQKEISDKIKNAENLRTRLAQAVERAEDEDRWPVMVGGKYFEKARAKSLLVELEQYPKDRQPMLESYDTFLAKLDGMTGNLRNDVNRLRQLRERLALDLEQVRLNQSAADLDKLRKTETELASTSRMLASMSDDAAPIPSVKEPPKANIDDILK